MDRNPQTHEPGSPQFDGATTNQQEPNQRTPPTRSTVSSLYPTARQSGHNRTPEITQQNGRIIDSDLPPNHMTLAVLSTILCVCPCGLVSLSYAVKVNPAYVAGNPAGAHYNSKKAWRWGIASVAFGCVIISIVICYFLVLISLRVNDYR